MPANADLVDGHQCRRPKAAKEGNRGEWRTGGSAGAMGNWLVPLSEHVPEGVAAAVDASDEQPNWRRAGCGAQLDYGAIVLTWKLCGLILPSPVVASDGPAV